MTLSAQPESWHGLWRLPVATILWKLPTGPGVLAVWPALALPVTTCRREQALKALKFGPDSGVAQLSAWQLWLSLKLDGGRVEICPSWGGGGPKPPPPTPGLARLCLQDQQSEA